MLPPNMDSLDAVKEVARFHADYLEMFTHFAKAHSLYIIGGSHPVETKGKLRNVAHLFTPRGDVYTQEKIHITTTERRYYDIQAGDKLRVFETPLGRIGILISYDVEFPELARLLSLHGIEVLFVPFATDERKSYYRVRHCAQARAVENVIYVVMTGSVGNLPQARSFLLNYGQAAICTPCDIAFPSNGILEEADPASETVIISELDLSDLAMARDIGSVKPLQDRRTDLYSLKSKMPIEIVSVL